MSLCSSQHKTFLPAFIFIFIWSIAFNQLRAQENQNVTKDSSTETFDIKNESFFLPLRHESGKYSHSLAIHYVVPPKDWTLDIIKAPFFNYSAKYSLPAGFDLHGDVSTIFVSNRVAAGAFWNYSIKDFHLGVGFQEVFNFGYLGSTNPRFGFHTTLTGWEQQPSLLVGYSFKNTAAILRGDLYYTTAVDLSEGGYVISAPEDFLNGYSVTARYEQRLHGNKIMSLGLKVNYVRYHIIAWPALPVNQYKYAVPEFQIALIL